MTDDCNMTSNMNAGVQPLKFGGKEVERRGGLNWHDFEARWLSNGRFTTQDPKRETYYPLSPYAYCADNPIKYVDPTGEKYEKNINDDNKQITISANYYQQEETASSTKAINFWNDQKGSYVINGNIYKVTFNLKLIVSKDPKDAANNDKIGNSIEVCEQLDKNNNGKTIGECFISITPSADYATIAHKIGHTLKLDDTNDFNSIMGKSRTHFDRETNILEKRLNVVTPIDIHGIVQRAGYVTKTITRHITVKKQK